MKKIILLVVLALIGVAAWYFFVTKDKPKVEVPGDHPVAVSKYSSEFNHAMNHALDNYYALSESFVNWDNDGITANTGALAKSIDSLQFEEIKKDTVIYETAVSFVTALKGNLATIEQQSDITEKRRGFQAFTQNFYDLLRTVKYDHSKVYLQECPMAFNDTETAQWLSKKSDIRNPYLGTKHPKYKSGMLECGETRDSLDFVTSN